MMEMLKFGRRVIFDKQMSNRDLLNTHLECVREMSERQKAEHDAVRKAERDYIDRRKVEEDSREAEKQFYNNQLRKDYARFNQLEQVNQEISKLNETSVKQGERNEYFPFVSGELME